MIRLLVLIGLGFGLLSEVARAQPGPPTPPTFAVLRGLLKFNGVKEPLVRIPPPRDDYGDVLLVIAGELFDPHDLESFSARVLREGGSVLLAPTNPEVELTHFLPASRRFSNITHTGKPVYCENPEYRLENTRDLPPFLERRMLDLEKFPDLNLQQIAARKLRVLTRRPHQLILTGEPHLLDAPLSVFPPGCQLDDNVRVTSQPAIILNTPGRFVPGRLAVCSSGRLFSDLTMVMSHPETQQLVNDNFAFAYFLTNYLIKEPSGKPVRTRCLFIENGRIAPEFDMVQLAAQPTINLPEVGLPPIASMQKKMVESLDTAIDRWQERDGPSEALLGQGGERFPVVLRFLLIAAGIGLSVLLARFLWSSRIISDRPPPPPPDPTINEPLLKQRRQALADLEDLRVPLQQQLKFVFQQWGAPADVVEDATPPMPEVITTTSRCKKQIRELWDLAYSRDRKTITTERWKEIEDMIEQLTEAAQTGQWHFGTVKEGR